MFTKFHLPHRHDSHSRKDEIKSIHGKFKTAIAYATILSFAFMLVLNSSWAKPKDKGKGKSTKVSYSESIEVNKGKGGTLKIVDAGPDKIEAKIKPRALDSYMEMLDLDKVEIGVKLKTSYIEVKSKMNPTERTEFTEQN